MSATTDAPAAPDLQDGAARSLTPAWLREFENALCTSSQFLLYGHIRDRVVLPADDGASQIAPTVVDAIWERLRYIGFHAVIVYDPVDGITLLPPDGADAGAISSAFGLTDQTGPPTLEQLATLMRTAVLHDAHHVAFIVDYASRLIPGPGPLAPEQHAFFAAAAKLSHSARPASVPGRNVPVFKPVIWMADGDRDLPDWLVAGNDRVRLMAVPQPSPGQREAVARLLAESSHDYGAAPEDDQREMIERFVGRTDGMTLRAMYAINRLSQDTGLGMRGIDDAARLHRVGVSDDPWSDPTVRARIAKAEAEISRNVVGQRRAVRRSLDILMRSAAGLNAAQAAPHSVRPRGVLFFAGPTGVGKTELAKAVARLVFGDEQALVRFDMSEFSQEHSAARLIGAPPGYVGFDAGGELTNAIRRRPLSVILFDEMDKASGRIFDSFLQILEDGRLTDGRGDTVYFSEAILIFTSNLGVYSEDEDGRRTLRITPADAERDPAAVERAVMAGVAEFFNERLQRPELLNRLGDNIVAFGFLARDSAEQILEGLWRNVQRRVHDRYGIQLELGEQAKQSLIERALMTPEHGGRAIGRALESAVVNPLARELFHREPPYPAELEIVEIRDNHGEFDLELR